MDKKWGVIISLLLLSGILITYKINNNTFSINAKSINTEMNKKQEKKTYNQTEKNKSISLIDNNKIKKNIYFLYAHPVNKPVQIATTENGIDFKINSYDKMDTFRMQKSIRDLNEVMLFSDHDGFIYYVDSKMKMREEKIENPLTFYYETKSLTVKSFNKDIEHNILEINDKKFNKTYSLTLPTFLPAAWSSEDYIIITNDDVNKQKSVAHIIQRTSGKTIKKFEVPHTTEMINFREEVIFNSEHKMTIFSPKTLTIRTVDYPFIGSPDKLFVRDDHLYMTYFDQEQNANLVIMDSKLNLRENINFKLPFIKSMFSKDKLYLLDQYEKDKKHGGSLAIINLEELKIETQIKIPKLKNKVQDFLLIN